MDSPVHCCTLRSHVSVLRISCRTVLWIPICPTYITGIDGSTQTVHREWTCKTPSMGVHRTLRENVHVGLYNASSTEKNPGSLGHSEHSCPHTVNTHIHPLSMHSHIHPQWTHSQVHLLSTTLWRLPQWISTFSHPPGPLSIYYHACLPTVYILKSPPCTHWTLSYYVHLHWNLS